MANAWFIYSNEVVSGPFSTEDVQLKSRSGQLGADSFIWWKGQREWVPLSTWQADLNNILQAMTTTYQKPVWYIDFGASPVGPLTQNELIENLRNISDLGQVMLWAIGMPKWKTIYELHDMMELLGISRREHDRAPLMGSVSVTRSNEDPRGFVAKAASISVAGMGISNAQDLRRGDNVALLIKSSDIPGNLHLHGEVVYVTDAGHAGIRFSKVHPETRTLIHDYVKQFMTDQLAEKNSAA